MDINLMIGIVGLILSIASISYAVITYKRSIVEKRLVYESLNSTPLAEVISAESPYSLEVVYTKDDGSRMHVQRVYIQFLRFANFGKSAIRRNDIANNDPITIHINHGQVLDVSLVKSTRDICNISLGTGKSGEESFEIPIFFDFLDNGDGCLIQVLSDSRETRATISGTVIGMPSGIQESELDEDGGQISGFGCVLFGILQVIFLGVAVFLVWTTIGGWEGIKTLLITLGLLAVPGIIFGLIMSISRPKHKFPNLLVPPPWYQFGAPFYSESKRMMLRQAELELMANDARRTRKDKKTTTDL